MVGLKPMKLKLFRKNKKRSVSGVAWLVGGGPGDDICVPGYTSLDKNPEIVTACRKIAELVGMLTIHILENTENGDKRIINELSAKIDIDPNPLMTRKNFIEAIVMNMLLYGKGNAFCLVNTAAGENGARYIGSLVPVPASKATINPSIDGYSYTVTINGRVYEPDDLLHFRFNPDKEHLWKGTGINALVRDLADNLKQAGATEKAFFSSKWKPSMIVKVDALTEEFASKEGRKKLLESYVESSNAGDPWLIPAEQFQVEQVRPLSLADLALADNVKLDKQAVAAIVGVPAFLLGVGDYSKSEWNAFINSTVRSVTMALEQEMTKKLILSPKWYIHFNIMSLYDWDLQTISTVFCALADRGFVTGNEVRDRIGMSPADGLDEFRILENFIPVDMSGQQKKLIQEGE